MGKYLRNSKTSGDSLALMDVSPSSLGVLTRAKSLALQRRLQKPSSSSPSSLPTSNPPSKQKQMTDFGGSYLQLRSRRLHKKPPIVVIRSNKRRKQQRGKETCGRNPNPNPPNLNGTTSDSVAESAVCGKEKVGLIESKKSNVEINKDSCFETSSGENFLQLQGSERTTRESTPCSLLRKPETLTSPGSSTKLNNCISESNQREESLVGSHHHLPSTPEIDEFFSGFEEQQQKQFIEKYNFDPVNERPLPGRYEWTKVAAD